jgi:hypothetical protein
MQRRLASALGVLQQATSRNVMVVVMVLMTSCQVSVSPSTRTLGSHSAMMSTHPVTNSPRLAKPAADAAKRSKSERSSSVCGEALMVRSHAAALLSPLCCHRCAHLMTSLPASANVYALTARRCSHARYAGTLAGSSATLCQPSHRSSKAS